MPTANVIHVDFRRQLQHVPYTHAERTEANRLEIVPHADRRSPPYGVPE